MSSLPNSPAVTDWFQRLEVAWRRMPAEERTRHREEVQQHLDALAKANEEVGSAPEEAQKFALRQFGDPAKFGKKMYQEWRQNRTGFEADMTAIRFGVGLNILLQLTYSLSLYCLPAFFLMMFVSVFGLLNCVPVGRKYPFQAIKGVFYAALVRYLYEAVGSVFVFVFHFQVPQFSLMPFHPFFLLLLPVGTIWASAIAYLASVTKRGWYKPTLDDFKLTLPKRRIAG